MRAFSRQKQQKQKRKKDVNCNETLVGIQANLRSYLSRFQSVFKIAGFDQLDKAHFYLRSLISGQTGKRNLEKLCQSQLDFSAFYQRVHHFISNSPWDCFQVKEIVNKINREFYNDEPFGYIIDEKSTAKKGKKSVGVSRQYCGQTGKIDNCQTGVYSVLAGRDFTMPCNYKLFLPKEWIEDKKRMKQSGLPGKLKYKTKVDLAMEMIKEDFKKGIKPEWYGGDALYGKAEKLLRLVEDELESKFVMDVGKDYQFYLKDPLKDRRIKTWTIEEWIENYDINKAKKIQYGSGKKVKAHVVEVYFVDWKKEPGKARKRLLIISKGLGKNDKIKYSISNFTLEEKSWSELVFMQRARFKVEQYFREASQIGGMCDYQVRGARGWNHCQALTMMLMQLLTLVKKALSEKHVIIPIISLVKIMECIIVKPKKYKIIIENILSQYLKGSFKSVF